MENRITALKEKFIKIYDYCTSDVWSDSRNNWYIDIIKTINLSVRSFLDKNLQLKACGLTYYTLLAIVPALALLFAIGRGFGFQNLLESELFRYFPAQSIALKKAFVFVDSYLAQSSTGIFIGIGIVFLLWTLISLMSSIEDTFNVIWGVKKGRSFYRKLTDYTAIFLILPILMICSSGISIFMTTYSISNNNILSPILVIVLDWAPYLLTWLFFAGTFMLIPYTKVKFKYAFIAGVISGTAFQLLQWLFVTGQLYVSKYNAIYGSFAFLPLLLIWLQLTWLICLSGVVLTYSSQNIFRFNFSNNIDDISQQYLDEITIVIMSIIVQRFAKGEKAYTKSEISQIFAIPIRLVGSIVDRLVDANMVVPISKTEDVSSSYQPAIDINLITLEYFMDKINNYGRKDFIPGFQEEFRSVITIYRDNLAEIGKNQSEILLKNLPLNI